MGRKTRSFEVTFEVVWALFAPPSPIRRSFVRMRGTTATYADRWNSVWNSVYQKDLWRTFWWRVLYVSKGDGNFPRPPPVILGVNHNSRALASGEMSVWTKKKKAKTKTCQKREQSWGDGSKVSNVNKSVVFHAYLNVALHARPWKIQKILPSKHKNRKTWYVFIKYKKHSKTYLESE